ncbi:preprotein translocase subunit YajC [Modestobacter lapidis]|nr:preprotein translocase subunit YajC [Modestobacter lapidis]
MEQFFPFILLAIALVVLIVLPARQRKAMQAKAQALQESLTVGSPILLTSGMYGTVTDLGEGTVDVEIAPGVVVTFVRAAVLEIRRPAVGDDVAGPAGGATPYSDGDGDPTDRSR